MQKERLVIKNFGPIKSIDLELGKMTILIGDQATGKSTIAKVLAVCRYFYLYKNKDVINHSFLDNLKNWGILSYLKKNSYIRFENENFSLEYNNSIVSFNVKSKELDEIYNTLEILYKDYQIPMFTTKDLDFFSKHHNFLNNQIELYFFIPIERNIQNLFTLGKGAVNNMPSLLFNQLSKINTILKETNEDFFIKPLDIYFKTKNGKSIIKKKDDLKYYSFDNSASGFQSVTPIVLSVNNFKDKEQTFIIEEPENNLFPKTQKKLMEFFVENINLHQHQFLLPTHSPYLLSALNNCLYAHKLSLLYKDSLDEIEKIIPKKYWIDIDEVSVYYLENGIEKDLVDTEEALINIDDLDSVSRDINKTFDELLTIEMQYV